MLTSDTKKKYKRILDLPIVNEIDTKLMSEWTLTATAKWIQAQGYLQDVPETTLITTLQKYRADLPPEKVQKFQLEHGMKETQLKMYAGSEFYTDDLDEIQELEVLYRLQMERIASGKNLENKLKMLINTMGGEIRVALDIIETRAKVKQAYNKVNKAPIIIPEKKEETLLPSPETQSTLDDPESKKKIFEAAAKLLDSIKDSE